MYRVEKSILDDSDYLITDTESQAKYFSKLFCIPFEKFFVINMSVDKTIFSPDAKPRNFPHKENFIVFTYATFLPLHGMMTIAKAANEIRNLPIRFVIAGGKGRALSEFFEYLSLNNVTNIQHIPWIEPEELPSYICGADLCLGGPFGGTPQAQRIITGKTLQFLAFKKPTVIGENLETNDFENRKNCLLVNQNDPTDLANAIQWAYNNPPQLSEVARLGKETYEQKYSSEVVKKKFKSLLYKL